MAERMWQEFVQRFASVDAEFTYDDVGDWGAKSLKALISLGLLHEVALATHVVCDACPEAHWEKVRWNADGSRAFIPCPAEGSVNVDRERLRLWQLDPSRLAAVLAVELGLTGEIEPLPAHRAWFMGQRLVAGRIRYFFFAAIGPDELRSIMKEIGHEYGRAGGALLLPFSEQGTEENKLIRIIDVSKVATLQGRRIAVDFGYIEEQFRETRRVPLEEAGVKGSARTLRTHRRRILKACMDDKDLDGMDALARRLGVSPSALYGMVRGDRSRYSEETLATVLTRLGCSPAKWNRAVPPAGPK